MVDPALDATIEPLVASFERGNFARVRRDAQRLLADPATPDAIRGAAKVLLDRTRPDPLSYVFFGLTALLLVVLSAYWWWRAGG